MTREIIIFFKNDAEIEVRRLVPGLFLFFQKALYEVIASGPQLSFNVFQWPSTWPTIKTNCPKLETIDRE